MSKCNIGDEICIAKSSIQKPFQKGILSGRFICHLLSRLFLSIIWRKGDTALTANETSRNFIGQQNGTSSTGLKYWFLKVGLFVGSVFISF